MVTVENNLWPFVQEAFVWGIGRPGVRTASLLAGFSIPCVVVWPESEKRGEGRGGEDGDPQGLVRVVRGEEILRIDGHFGRFRIRVRNGDGSLSEHEAGVVFVVQEEASQEMTKSGISLPKEHRLTVDELEALASSERGSGLPDSIGVWLDPAEGLPDRVMAERALRAVLRLQVRRKAKCFVLARHVPVRGLEGQSLYDELREQGVRFLRVGTEAPGIKVAGGRIEMEVRDRILSDRIVSLELDRLLVVGQPRPPADAGKTALCIGDVLDAEGFLQKDNVHLYPSRSFRKGIYYLGPCKGEQTTEELAEEVAAILPEIVGPIAAGEIRVQPGIRIDRGHCVSCLTCYRVCPHHALEISRGPVPVPLDPACCGCGLCAALCPGNAIELAGRSGSGISGGPGRKNADGEGGSHTTIFCCSRSPLASDGAEERGRLLPAQTSVIEIPCSCSVSEEMLLAAFRDGSEKVVVVGCHADNCVSHRGSMAGIKRTERVAGYLAAAGRDPGKSVRFVAVAPNEAHRLWRLLRGFAHDHPGPGGRPVADSFEGATS